MELEELEAVPGVGGKTAERLAELEDPEGALAAGDVAALARAPDVSEARAARIARAAIRHRHHDDGEFLATERAAEIHDAALELLAARAVTDYGEKRLQTFYPSAAASRIEEAQSFARGAVERTPTDAVLAALEDVAPLSPPPDVRVRDRCVATADAETYAAAQEAVPELSVELVEDARAVADLARGYATVVVLDDSFGGIDVAGDVRVDPAALDEPAALVPERTLSFFARNRDRIRAAADVHRAADLSAPCNLDTLDDALGGLAEDGTVADDGALDALDDAIDDLDAAVSLAESVADDHLRDVLERRDVTIEGADLLSLVERGAGVDSLLQRELADEYETAVEAARDHLVDALGLVDHAEHGLDDHAPIAGQAFDDTPSYPVEHDEQAVERLREALTADRDRRATRLKRDLADELRAMRAPARTLVEAALELDVELAVSRFAREFDCTFPTFEGRGVAVEGGRSPLLEGPFDDVEPVDYAVAGTALLSGVNSGGKTSTLDLLALVVVLAQMGLPVPADDVRLERFEALHYQAKTQGTLSAGAFETTLREFGSLVAGDRRRLVLVDELESITEPGASAVIIAGILEQLADSDATAVFVSHLAGEIRAAADTDVTVDGIEALGLEDGELLVDRSPVKDHLARSTPELIVEKLAAEDGQDLYDELLAKFDDAE